MQFQAYLIVRDVDSTFQVHGSEFVTISTPHELLSRLSAGISVLRNLLQAAKGLRVTADVSRELVNLGTLYGDEQPSASPQGSSDYNRQKK